MWQSRQRPSPRSLEQDRIETKTSGLVTLRCTHLDVEQRMNGGRPVRRTLCYVLMGPLQAMASKRQ